jgi:threo-3-hydroxy-L-aspartate ammonia-lyase
MYDKILAAQERLKENANHTPVLTSRTLNKIAGVEVFLKCENFQRVGAFKFRGAFNAISQLSDEEKLKGVITYSSGNHAQAVALVGKLLGIKTTIVMPQNAPEIKKLATEEYGAEVIYYDTEKNTREEIVANIQKEKECVLIPPFDNIEVAAGQGTAALELLQDIENINFLLVPCGGGGLLSGSAVAAKGLNKNCKVIGIEPEVADDAVKSFHTKVLSTVKNPPTIADGTRTASLGKITFPLVLENVYDMGTVTEKSIMEAVKFLFYRMKIVVEPSGALGVAALLEKSVKVEGRVGIILSGGNIDAQTLQTILNS